MLRLMSPPVGFGTKCPSKLAYKVRISCAIFEAERAKRMEEINLWLIYLAIDSYEYAD